MRDAAQAALEQQRGQMRRDTARRRPRHLAVTIASRLLAASPRSAMNAALLEALASAADRTQWRSLAAPEDVAGGRRPPLPWMPRRRQTCADMVHGSGSGVRRSVSQPTRR